MCGLSPPNWNCPKYFTVCHLIVPSKSVRDRQILPSSPRSPWLRGHRVCKVIDYADKQISQISWPKQKRSWNCFCLFKRGPGKVFDKTGSKISGHCPFYAFIQHQLVGLIIPRYTVSWSLYCTATVAWTEYAHNMTLSERIIENVLTFSASWLRKTFTTPGSHLKIWLNFSF